MEIKALENNLLSKQGSRWKAFALQGLGGIRKTQLSAEFARRFRHIFSSLFWLDGDTEDGHKSSIAGCIDRIPAGHIPEACRINCEDSDVKSAVRVFKGWLSKEKNTDWLVNVNNLDKEYRPGSIQNFIVDYVSEGTTDRSFLLLP